MKWLHQYVGLVLIALICTTGCAQQLSSKEICPETITIDHNGRRACISPKTWTGDYIPTDIRQLFVEAPGEVALKVVPPRPWSQQDGQLHWIDNQRMIGSVNAYMGWIAGVDELPKVLIFNVDTGQVEETPYRGRVRCLSPEGHLLLEEKPNRASKIRKFDDPTPYEEFFFEGQFGKPLTRFGIKFPSKENWGINDFDCTYITGVKAEIPPGRFLRKGDGFIAWPDSFHGENHTRLLDESGRVVYVFNELNLCNKLYMPQYLPWLNKYFSSASVGQTSGGFCPDGAKYYWLISASGVEVKELPQLFQAATTFGHGLAGSGRDYWTRRGQFITVSYSDSYRRKTPRLLDGLYWQDEKTGVTKRVLPKAYELSNLSPNGCRSFNGDVIIELCKAEKP